MKVPKRLEPLVHEGLIDEVLGALKSGKEAAVYVVRADGVVRCAKVYKAVDQARFPQAVAVSGRAGYGCPSRTISSTAYC
jgi:RIO kinase 1